MDSVKGAATPAGEGKRRGYDLSIVFTQSSVAVVVWIRMVLQAHVFECLVIREGNS